jgi:DNA-binding transcriptional LysR family regulator
VDLLSHMTTFVRVIDAGSLSSAARTLNMSLAAVSRQIGALEKETGTPLILRSTRKHTITEAGRRYYDQCVRVLREVDAAQAIARSAGGVEGVLTVSAPVTLGLEKVLPHIPSLLAKHAGLRVDLRLEDRFADIVGEGIDVAIRGGGMLPESTSFMARRLMSYPRIVVASPSYLKTRAEPRAPHELIKHEALLHASAGAAATSWRFSRGNDEYSVRLNWTFRSNLVYALRDAALAGMGIALVPDWLVEREVEAGRLRRLLADYATEPMTISAVYRRELKGSPRVRALLALLAAAYGHHE